MRHTVTIELQSLYLTSSPRPPYGAITAYVGSEPIYIPSEGSRRTSGRDAQSTNIVAGRAVAGAVRTTLGPKGMDETLVDRSGTVVVTNDGVTVLDEMAF